MKNVTKHKGIRFNTKVDMENLVRNSAALDFSPVYESDNLNCATDIFIKLAQGLILSNSLQYRLPRNRVTMKPWITTGLLRCMKNRDKMHLKVKKEPENDILKTTYKRYRNFCNDTIKKCKRQYEKEELRAAGSNSKKLWQSIKNITNLNTAIEPPLQLLSIRSSPEESVDFINKYFVNVGANLASKISPSVPVFPESLIGKRTEVDSFYLVETDCEEVEKIIVNLRTCNSVGWDGISTKVLKAVKNVIVPPLTYLFNRCLSEGVFPVSLKKSVVIPVFKTGKKT